MTAFPGILCGKPVLTPDGFRRQTQEARMNICVHSGTDAPGVARPTLDWFWSDVLVELTLGDGTKLLTGPDQLLLSQKQPLPAHACSGQLLDAPNSLPPLRVVSIRRRPVTGRVFRFRLPHGLCYTCSGVLIPSICSHGS
jgi:hypothetical protein